MSLNCRVFRDEKGQIDFVNAPNGNRSKLFDTLVNITGGNKNTALNIYALTETEDLKDAVKAKVNSFKERFKNIVKIAPSYSNMNAPIERVRFSKTVNTSGYFSNALSAISNLSDKNPKNTQGWIKQLTDVQKNGGVKNVNQELQWIGLEDYLNDYVKENNPKAGNIPASVVEDYIKSNQIEIVDVSKGYTPINNKGKTLVIPRIKEEILAPKDYVEKEYKKEEDGTTISFRDKQKDLIIPRFSVIVASTGEVGAFINNKIEYFTSEQEAIDKVLESIPEKKQYVIYNEFGEKLEGYYDAEWMAMETYHYNDANQNYANDGVSDNAKYSGYQLKGGENYREVLLTMPPKKEVSDKISKVLETATSEKDVADQLFNDFIYPQKALDLGYTQGDGDIANMSLALAMYEGDSYGKQSLEERLRYVTEDKFEEAKLLGEKAVSLYKSSKNKEKTLEGLAYKSSHWDEANILAHVRMNEKTLPDGRKVLIVNEIQSDWAQEGRKVGFINKELQRKSNIASTKYKALQEELTKIKEEKKLDKDAYQRVLYNDGKGYTTNVDEYGNVTIAKSVNDFGKQLGDSTGVEVVKEEEGNYRIYVDGQVLGENSYYGSKEVAERTIEERKNRVDFRRSLKETVEIESLSSVEQEGFRVIQDYYSKVTPLERQIAAVKRDIIEQSGIQPMPYTNTDQWVGLATRRIIQMAAQEGYDGVAFATGQQSADMYSLAKQVDNISWDTSDNTLTAFDKNGNQQFQQSNVTDEKLENFVGKEVAEKLIKRKESLTEEDEGVVNLENADLEVGGEGMKTFYDKIVPKVVQKEAQRFDKNAKLETVDFSDNFTFSKKELDDYTNYLLNKYNLDKTGRHRVLIEKNATAEELDKYKNLLDNFRKDNDSKKSQGDKLSLAQQPYIAITDKMRSELQEAIPLFSKNQGEQAPKEVMQEVTDRLKQSGLAKNVYQMSNSEINEKLKELGEENVDMTTAGFTYQGDVYLNTDVMGLDTPIHEFGHLHLDWLKENRTDLYQAGLSLIEKNKEEAKQYIDIVKETQPDLKEGTEKFNNEVLAQVIGDQGARLVNSNKENTLADWLKNVWEAIKNFIGLTDYTAEQVANMTLAEFGTASAAEMLSGSRIQRSMGENNVYLRYKYDNNQVARERFDIPNLKEISSGSDRVVFDLGDGKVLKVANTARGLAQNMQEGDAQLIEKGLIPQVYETGLNYVVVERVQPIDEDTRVPVYKLDTGEAFDTEPLGTMISELEYYTQADFDVKDPDLIDILKNYGVGAMADYDILFGDLLNPANWGMKDGKLIHLDAGTFGGMYMIRQYARRKDLSFQDFENVYNKSQEAKAKFGDTDWNVNFSIVAGNKLFNEPLEEAGEIANEYMNEKGFSTAPIQKITKLDTENSKKIAQEFDKMKPTPNDPETKAAYKAMVEETLEQYEKILSKGYKVEINNSEPYDSSADMIADLRDNKRMKIFSTESGFGDEAITDTQRKENPLLQQTKYKDANGVPLLANDVFRFVHDFFGHAKFGNGFGAVGEENAWNIHARMYSPLARRAMTTETRGQNSWVNFSGVNAEVFKKRDRARMLRQEGKIEEAKKLTEEVYEEMSFAEQKIGLLPEWVSIPYSENISPENSSNYANLTEDGQGNFVFYHVGNSGYETIKRSSGATLATSKQEAQALSKVGGLAMYYTRPEDGESMVKGDSKYMVKIPMEKVYDFNTDSLGLTQKAKELHSKEHPGKAFDANTQVAYVTKLAGELGYEMVVAEWANRTRAQSIKELIPIDTQVSEGSVIKKPFKENYDSNSTKGFKSVIPIPKDEQLKQLYLDLNNYRNRENKYDNIYRLYEENTKLSQEEITDRIKNSDLPQEYKSKYESILNTPEERRRSNYPISKSVKRAPSLELNGTRIFAKERVNPITGESMGDIEWELIESTERGQGNARKAAELFLNGTDAQGKDVYLAISPRDAQTSPERLESFYSSLGFKKVSDFEMVRKATPVTPKDIDSNGEVSVKALMDFSNSKAKPLNTEGIKAAKNAAMGLKVKNSQELIEKMEKALMKNGIILFDKLSLQRSKLYNIFEINTILSSPSLQKQIKESLLALKNSEPFQIDYNENFIVPQGREVNQFGKQEVLNPNTVEKDLIESVAGLSEDEIDEALPAAFSNKYYTDADFRETVDSIARDYKKAPIKELVEGELVDKTEDVKGMLTNTVTEDFNEDIAEDIRFLREEIDEDIFNSNLTKVSKILNKIKKNAYINGIDLRNFPTLALELSRDQVLGFLDSMEDMLSEPYNQELFDEFSDRYYEILGEKETKTEVIKSNSQNDVFVEEPLSEYEMFSRFGLVKKQDNVYRKVTDTPLETLYENFFEHKNLLPEGVETLDSLKDYVQKNTGSLEVSDYEVDVDNLEKMFLYKKFFEFPMSTVKPRVSTEGFDKITNSEDYLVEDFVKEFNKWILATGNTYFKVTNKGIELTQKDDLSKAEAVESVPVRFKQDLAEYNIISNNLNLDLPLEEEQYRDVNTQYEERQKAVNNPDSVEKVTGQYTYLKDGILAVKNEGATFVKTPIGIFEKIFEFANIKFYGKLDTDTNKGYKKIVAEAPFSDINFNDYMYLETTPEVFKNSKNYYSRKELDDINKDYFECQ